MCSSSISLCTIGTAFSVHYTEYKVIYIFGELKTTGIAMEIHISKEVSAIDSEPSEHGDHIYMVSLNFPSSR